MANTLIHCSGKFLNSTEHSKRLPILPLVIRKKKAAIGLQSGQPATLQLHFSGTTTSSHARRGFLVYSVPPGNHHDHDHDHHSTSGDSPSSWQQWIFGIITTVIIPFLYRKWTMLLKIKDEVDTVVEETEQIVDFVEEVAETVDNVVKDVADHLPEGGKWRNAAMFVEGVAEEVAKEAHLVEDFLHDVEQVEEKVELLVESVSDQPKNIHQDLNTGA